jgi:hypothetical protein
MPKDEGTTIACASELKEPALPVVKDACGNELTGVLKSVTPTELPTCEGTVTYVYTFTDCANHSHDWSFVYKIEKTSPVISSGGIEAGKVISCIGEATEPTAIPTAKNSCGESVTPTVTRTEDWNGGTEGCSGKILYTYTYTDCGKSSEWVYTYTLKDDVAPSLVAGEAWPADITGQDACAKDIDKSALLSETQVKAMYKDNCSEVEVSYKDGDVQGDDCSWSIVRTYTIRDACGNTVTPSPMQTISGGDKTAPTLSGSLAPLEATGCSKENAPAAYTSMAELAAAGLTVSDNCRADFTISSEDV